MFVFFAFWCNCHFPTNILEQNSCTITNGAIVAMGAHLEAMEPCDTYWAVEDHLCFFVGNQGKRVSSHTVTDVIPCQCINVHIFFMCKLHPSYYWHLKEGYCIKGTKFSILTRNLFVWHATTGACLNRRKSLYTAIFLHYLYCWCKLHSCGWLLLKEG